MQAPTHFLVGITIQLAVVRLFPTWPLWLVTLLAFVLAAASHFLVDVVALLTYHPPDPRPGDKFWVGYHIWILGLTVVLAVVFIRGFFWVLLGSLLVDVIDWGILRGVLHREPKIHPIIDRMRTYQLFRWMPNWTLVRWTALLEAVLLGLLAWVIYLLW